MKTVQLTVQLSQNSSRGLGPNNHKPQTSMKRVEEEEKNALALRPKPKPVATVKLSGKRALLFTMDSMASYESNSLQGGAAGEILIRKCLADAFAHLGVSLAVIGSDQDFDRINADNFDIIILDPWTWAAKGEICLWMHVRFIEWWQSQFYPIIVLPVCSGQQVGCPRL